MMSVGSPVQNVFINSLKKMEGSLVLMNSIDSLEDDLNDFQKSLICLNINDKNIMEPDRCLNQKQLHHSHSLSSTSSLSSNEGRPNKSIAVISMKNLLEGVNCNNCVDLSDGGDSNAPKAPVIREERVKLLQDQLGFYMSDINLIKDLFLLKKFKELKGWISIKFLMSYKRIRRTAKDIDELKEAIQLCPLLEMNKEETKVRHLNILPNVIKRYIPSKIAVVGGLQEHFKNINEASRLMCLYGDVVALQLLRPRGVLPEVLQTVEDLPEIRTQWCIVVEYEEMHSAGKLVSDINRGSDPNLPSWAVEMVISWKEVKQKSWKKGSNKSPSQASLTSTTSSGCTEFQYSSTQSTLANSPFIENRKNAHGLTKKNGSVTSRARNSSEDRTVSRQLGKPNQQQNQYHQQQNQQQYYQPQRKSNHIQTSKPNSRYHCESSSTDSNWRSNRKQNWKRSNSCHSERSSEDDNWRRIRGT